jgi:hypothetical protein
MRLMPNPYLTDKKKSPKKPDASASAPKTAQTDDTGFTFELFVSTAILQQNKETLLACEDMAEVFGFING